VKSDRGAEKLVKARRLAIDEAKQILDSAHAQQGSSQKEVVALLERKHSWSAIDLERYMALIRSEHINDQAVNRAKEAVQEAENALEEARSHLEKRERAQYHEEQIWSDTIRRNSTWVTFGLMGLNIFLLLASLVAIEPWRRSKMVKEIRRALEAQKTAMGSTVVEPTRAALPASPIEAEIGAAAVSSPEAVTSIASTPSLPPAAEAVKAVEATTPVQGIGSYVRADPSSPGAAPLTPVRVDPQEAVNIEEEVRASTTPGTWYKKIKFAALDLVSDRTVSVRKIDFTTAVFQAATIGAFFSAALIALIRSN
jgi:sensitive to high expression protein 9